MNTKEVGNLTELQCLTALYALGCDVSIPFGNSQKYDLIMDYKGRLYKVQCKHANEKSDENGQITHFVIKTRWQGHNRTGYTQTAYTKDDIDFFCSFCQGECYLLPIEECSNFEKTVRFVPPKNNQKVGITFAENYTAKEVLGRL